MSSILEKSVWKIAFPVQSVRPINQNLIRKHMLCGIECNLNIISLGTVSSIVRWLSYDYFLHTSLTIWLMSHALSCGFVALFYIRRSRYCKLSTLYD
jgi:hypothetical protein